jgi:hypothetical protein
MSTFKEIRGTLIKSLSSDPSPTAAGDMWYNSTSQTLKGQLLVSAWGGGGNVNTARYASAGAGTQTAGLVAGGSLVTANSEEYNGSVWSEGNNLNTARMYVSGTGTQTAALASNGDQYPSPRFSNLVEEYNGTSWSAQNTSPVSIKQAGSCGIQTATLIFGGSPGVNTTQLYDGTNWTATGHNINTARDSLVGMGTSTAALAVGGPPTTSTTTEEYNGSSWTSVTGTPSPFGGSSSAGTQTAGLIFSGWGPGGSGYNASTASYDGTNWSTQPNVATARSFANLGPIGSSTSALFVSGQIAPGVTVNTEEFTAAAATKTFTTS